VAFSSTPEAVGSPGQSSGALVAYPAVVPPLSVGFASVGSELSSQLVSSSWVSSPVSPDFANGAFGLVGSLSKPGEVSALTGPALSSLVSPLFLTNILSQGLGSLTPALDTICDCLGVLSSSQQHSPGQEKVPQARKVGCGLAFPSVSSGAVELGEQLHLSLPVPLKFGAPIYPS
jgi:hypothetical protein